MPLPVLVILLVLALLAVWITRTAGWRFALQRLGGSLLIVVIVTFATTALLRFVGVDEGQKELFEELGLPASSQPCFITLGTGATSEAIIQCVEDRGLEKNVFAQYGGWLRSTLSGDLGYSFTKNEELLSDVIRERAPRSLWLFLYSQVVALGLAIPLGVWSAYQSQRRPRPLPRWVIPGSIAALAAIGVGIGWSLTAVLIVGVLVPLFVFNAFRGGPGGDNAVNSLAFVLLSIPAFVIGETFRYFFAIDMGWYDLKGYLPWSDGVGAHLGSMWLPALVLGLAALPVYLRLLRADMIQNLQQDYVTVAKAKGLPNYHILLRHVLRPSTLTLLTVAGLNIAQLVNGAIVIEFIFNLNGLGSFLIEEVARQEFFAIQTMVALISLLFVLTNTVIDVLYTAVDPRVGIEGE